MNKMKLKKLKYALRLSVSGYIHKAPSSYDGHSDAAAELCVAEKIYGTAHF
jgi:hypothetical protein